MYITTPDIYLSLDGENIVALRESETLTRVPLHNLEGIVTFGYTGVSPALMGACADRGISLTFLTANGRFLAEVCGTEKGGAALRRVQYRISGCEEESLPYARNMLIGKLFNGRWVL
jgi:CRISPR-associated protein Cas1